MDESPHYGNVLDTSQRSPEFKKSSHNSERAVEDQRGNFIESNEQGDGDMDFEK